MGDTLRRLLNNGYRIGIVENCLLIAKWAAGGKSVNILGPINGLAMSNLGKANFGEGFLSLLLQYFSQRLHAIPFNFVAISNANLMQSSVDRLATIFSQNFELSVRLAWLATH